MLNVFLKTRSYSQIKAKLRGNQVVQSPHLYASVPPAHLLPVMRVLLQSLGPADSTTQWPAVLLCRILVLEAHTKQAADTNRRF